MVSDLSLHERSRRARLHHQYSTTTSDTIFYIAPSSCVRGARISASFHHDSRRDKPSSATTRDAMRKISFKPTSRRSSHPQQGQHRPAPLRTQRGIRPGGTGFRHPHVSPGTACGWDVQSDGTLTEMYKTGNLDGTNALIYRRSDGINVAVTLNRTPREKYCRACPDDTVTPDGEPVPDWNLLKLVPEWLDGVSSWPSVNLWSEFLLIPLQESSQCWTRIEPPHSLTTVRCRRRRRQRRSDRSGRARGRAPARSRASRRRSSGGSCGESRPHRPHWRG